LGRRPLFDALWLASYGDRHEGGEVEVRASLQRPVRGRRVLLIEDVLDSGRSLKEAVRIARAGGAAEVLTAVFARKPWAGEREVAADFVAWNAPARWLVGYGMDERGRFRGLPYVGALD
jgi:hypoxanthine phosphoribosyltransferase